MNWCRDLLLLLLCCQSRVRVGLYQLNWFSGPTDSKSRVFTGTELANQQASSGRKIKKSQKIKAHISKKNSKKLNRHDTLASYRRVR